MFEQPGKLRVGVFANSGNTTNYREAVDRGRCESGARHQRRIVSATQRDRAQIRLLSSISSSRS